MLHIRGLDKSTFIHPYYGKLCTIKSYVTLTKSYYFMGGKTVKSHMVKKPHYKTALCSMISLNFFFNL